MSPILRPRYPEIDALRGLACLMVVWAHVWQWSGHPFRGHWISSLRWGTAGVDLFFVLSGFLITGILLDHRENPAYYRVFYARRALRILPLFYLVLAVNFLLLPALGVRISALEAMGFAFYASNLLMAWRGFAYGPPLDITWSLAIEEQFYLLWPAAVRVFRGAGLVALVAAVLTGGVLLRAMAFELGWPRDWQYVFTLTHLDGIMFGCLLALALRAGWLPPQVARRVAAFGILLGGAAFVTNFALHQPLLRLGLERTVDAVILASVVLGVLACHDTIPVRVWLANPVLRYFGKVSYAMYLVHLLVIAAFTRGFSELHPDVPFVFQLALVVGGSTAVAATSWRFFEGPILGLKRRFEYADVERPRSRPAPGLVSTVRGAEPP